MSLDNTLTGLLRGIAEKNPDSAALIFPERQFTFGETWKLICAFSTRMREVGIGPGSCIEIVSSLPEVVLVGLLAAGARGASVVQNLGGVSLPEFVEVTHRIHGPDSSEALAPGSIAIDDSWSPDRVPYLLGTEDDLPGVSDPDEIWIYNHSSGTTGFPKFLGFSHRMMIERSLAVADQFKAGESVLTSLFPPKSRPFASRVLGAISNGCPVVISRDISFWQQVGVTMVSGSVAQARSFFADRQIEPRLPLIEVPGSRVDEETARLLLQSFEQIDETYGSGETNKVFSNFYWLDDDGRLQSRTALRDSEIEIVDEDGAACPDGGIGYLRIRNPYMIRKYLNHPEAEAKAFRDGWFYPGDKARWSDGGKLEILGRGDGVVNIAGFKLHALGVDQILRSVDGIADGVCFKNPKDGARDELFAFIVLDGSVSQLQAIATAKHRIDERMGPEVVPRVFQAVSGIPRRSDGSPDREACAALVLQVSANKKNSEDHNEFKA